MRFPLSWLAEYVDIPLGTTAQEIADMFTRVGFETEEVVEIGAGVRGPLQLGRVLEFVEEPQANGKTIRWCQVEVAPGDVRGIVCGARNFFVGDKVVVVLPGAVLPGGFEISARKTYGHVSDGMICSARELQYSDDHDGIIRLSELGLDPELGTDAIELLQLRDWVIDLSVLPDRGYAMSMRGLARELAGATGWGWRDPADIKAPVVEHKDAVKAEIVDPTAASRIVLRTVSGFNPTASVPAWMARRIYLCGMRSISLSVDVTNYLMLELGQPLHAFDADKLQGHIRVRRAGSDNKLRTLDDVVRTLDATDIVIADDSGPVALAGTMGGASTEQTDATTRIVIEAANFSFPDVARTSRQHKLSSEASRRFERGVDPELCAVASARAVELLTQFGGGSEAGASEVDLRGPARTIELHPQFVSQYIGADYSDAEVRNALLQVGCEIQEGATWLITPASWRTDLIGKADLVEEVARVCGYDRIPSVLPVAGASRGLTEWQRQRRAVARSLAGAGLVEVLNYPFVGSADFDALGIESSDPRRSLLNLANPISAEQPGLRTTLLPPLLAAARRNIGRGQSNVALFEIGKVVLPDGNPAAPRLAVDRKPTREELTALDAAVPAQPTYVSGVMTGAVENGTADVTGEWTWAGAISAAVSVADSFRLSLATVPANEAPWHPGRCAALAVGDEVVGFAGELHPRVCEKLGLPARTVAFEVDLSALAAMAGAVVTAAPVRTYPKALQDVALVVDEAVAAADVQQTLLAAGGDLLEQVSLFDVYTGDPVPSGAKSLAFALTFRAPDRTLTDADVLPLKDAMVQAAAEQFGAKLR